MPNNDNRERSKNGATYSDVVDNSTLSITLPGLATVIGAVKYSVLLKLIGYAAEPSPAN